MENHNIVQAGRNVVKGPPGSTIVGPKILLVILLLPAVPELVDLGQVREEGRVYEGEKLGRDGLA